MKTLGIFLLVIVMGTSGAVYYRSHASTAPTASLRTATIQQGDLFSTISATGTIEPEEVIDVGAQVMGRIKDFGIDHEAKKLKKAGPAVKERETAMSDRIDYGSIVHVDTELAYIDDTKYKAQVRQAQAALDRAQADMKQLQAKAVQANAELRRAENLRTHRAISEADYDLSAANAKVAEANLAVGAAAVEQSRAALAMAQTDLEYTVIKSPVEGVIVDRRVNIGQTVVAALNAPSLFLIAKDLSRLQVWASVNEADIGRLRKDMPVKFTVDAFPGETFVGRVQQIRLNAQMTQNVVTYTVVVETSNPDGKLLPYLTANLQFEIERHSNVLLAPNAALRWNPRDQAAAPGETEQTRIWIKEGDALRSLAVTPGATDGLSTIVVHPELKAGAEVVIGEASTEPAAAEEAATNPFGPPKFPGAKDSKK